MTPATPAHILVVEDEPLINQSVTDRLRAEGFTVSQAFDGPGAVAAYAELQSDLLVLDLMLPGFDGLEVCRRVQAQRPVPVLMLTARDEESDMVIGLAVGADDYMTKPFSSRELVARVRALLRRVERAAELATEHANGDPSRPATLIVGDLAISVRERRVMLGENAIHLTPLEFDLLASLASDPGAVLSREQLMHQVWGWSDASGTRTLDSHIKSLRAKIGAERIRTVHGIGYAVEQA